MSVRPGFLLALLFPLIAACASWSGVRFEPSPLEVAVAPDAGGPALGRAVFSWRGIGKKETGHGHAAYFLVRIENDTSAGLELDPARCELLDGSLTAFGPARVSADEEHGVKDGSGAAPWTIAPAEARVFELVFPFPGSGDPADRDLSGLHLRIGLVDATGPIVVSATFERLVRQRGGWYGPYGHASYWHVHGGSDVSLGIGSVVRF